MVEFKNVNFSAWTSLAFNLYNSYSFTSGSIAVIKIYNKILSDSESKQNFEALRGRYGI